MLSSREGTQLKNHMKDYVVFDLETTGINPATAEIIELSAVRVIGGEAVEEFSSLVRPRCPIPPEATAVNGITDGMVRDAPSCREVLKAFLAFAGELPLVGHNIKAYDLKILKRECMAQFDAAPDNDYLDTLQLARLYLPKLQSHSLTALCHRFGIPAEGAHRALNDCRMNHRVFERLAAEMAPAAMERNGVHPCPKCGAPMKLRSGRFGPFLSCSEYPACNGTRNPSRQEIEAFEAERLKREQRWRRD